MIFFGKDLLNSFKNRIPRSATDVLYCTDSMSCVDPSQHYMNLYVLEYSLPLCIYNEILK